MGKDKKQKTSKPSNAAIEMRWVDAWNELCEIIGERRNVRCLLPDGVVVDVESGLTWLQEAVYDGHQVTVERGYVFGRPGVILLRST